MTKIEKMVNELKSLKGLHLSEINVKYNTSCTCDWCAFLVDLMFRENFNISLSRSCTMTREILRKHKDFKEVNSETYNVGDIILYDWDKSGDCDHIGIVSSVKDGKIKTMEGNVKNNDFTKSVVDEMTLDSTRKKYVSNVFRYVKDTDVNFSKNSFVTTITMSDCSKNGGYTCDKLIAQAMLTNYGYYHGYMDGIFGEMTISSIKEFQRVHGLNVTGIVNLETWKELFKLI